MAIAFDASSENNVAAGTATSTHAHTCTGSDLILYIGIAIQNTSGLSTVTYNGVSATLVGEVTNGVSDKMHLYRLVAPATGSNNVVVTRVSTTGGMWVKVASYTGVDQSSPSDDIDTGSTTGTVTELTITTTPTQNDGWAIFYAANWDGGTVTAGTGLGAARASSNLWNRILDTNATIASGANSLTAVKPSGVSGFTGVVESFKVAGAGGLANNPHSNLSLMGVS